MDINLIRTLVTLFCLAAFLGIVWWAYLPSRKQSLELQAMSILESDAEMRGEA
ncbi:MAG TPA: CcoQ/FixQ family Cbb3-type cytochrome c oxidase assembly chaperone [Burkholderiales bacterium]|jgi:cbb3-type cytochrome oxidase subunit 3|nr:CcoQ/FixQ family Cbb3-type cytochrome c oxidase assembly chaperone [Burkholderiales bacterium]